MKRTLPALSLIFLAAALVVATPIQGQATLDTFELEAGAVAPYLDPTQPTDLPIAVIVGCDLAVRAGPEGAVMISGNASGFGSVAPLAIPIDATPCATGPDAPLRIESSVSFEPMPGADGLVPFDLELVAVLEDLTGTMAMVPHKIAGLAIDYTDGHTLSPSGDQVFQVDGEAMSFDLQIDIGANARTMVMFENTVISAGSLSGLAHKVFEVPSGDTTKTYSVVWTAPDGAWEEETVQFYNYSHCLDREGCTPTNEADITWTFVNANPESPGAPDNGNKDSPGLAPFALIGLVVFAAAQIRRGRG